MAAGLQARIYDPLWLLARQWQLGEFQGSDNGSPAMARWQGEVARLTRYGATPGAGQGQPFDSASMPLETLVEREPAQSEAGGTRKLRFAADAGQHLLRMLDQQATSRSYREVFNTSYGFTPLTAEERERLDTDSLRLLDLVGPRVPDGRKLHAALSPALRPAPPTKPALPPGLGILPGDVREVMDAAQAWLQWYDTVISEPGGVNPSWSPPRMEYGFSVAARTGAGERVLRAQEYWGGQLDWHDFDVHEAASLGAGGDRDATTVTRTTIPAPVTYPGMPAARFWEFEDARVEFGAVSAGPEDLARMLLVEFALGYGNDWFVIPVDLATGSLCRTSSLVVTNTFGERFLIPSPQDAGQRYAEWRMFQLSSVPQPGQPAAVGDPGLFLLPPTVVSSLGARPIEEVLFLRDEMANMAWGVERVVESAGERPLNRFEQIPHEAPEARRPQGGLLYKLASPVPNYWVPLLPVATSAGLRLRRGRVLEPDGALEPVQAQGRVLNPDAAGGDGLSIYEEEIPREGVRVTRGYRLARWQDGSTHLWIGRSKEVGRGEGSSGLRFDTLEG
jgi:hypothetical protein